MIGIIRKAFEDHYWDTFESDKELIMLHINAELDMLQPSESNGPPHEGRTAKLRGTNGDHP